MVLDRPGLMLSQLQHQGLPKWNDPQGISKQYFPEFPIESMGVGVDMTQFNIKILKVPIPASKILAFFLLPPRLISTIKMKIPVQQMILHK